MNNPASKEGFGGLAPLLVGFAGIALFISSLTQMVGISLGAPIAASFILVSTAAAIHFGYRWRRSAFVLFHPLVLVLLVAGDGHVFLGLIGLLIYFYGIARIVLAGSHATLSSSPDGPGTLGSLFSLLLMIVAAFLFGWWWTNASAAMHLFARRDFQGIGVCFLFLCTAVVIGSIALGIWWRHRWRSIAGAVILATGVALGIHAVYYSIISASALSDNVVGSTVGSIILGRFVFAIGAIVIGVTFLRRSNFRI